MSWLFSQALVEEYSVDTSLDGEPSALLSRSHTQQAYCAPDKMTDFSRLSRFGMTYKVLEENRGEELLTLYRAAFHVPTFPQQEKGQESMEKPLECGEKWRGSFTKYDQNSCSWKTHQCSLLGDLDEFLETWPQWGLMRGGECWEQQTLAQTTRGTGFGLWATPAASDGQRGRDDHGQDDESKPATDGQHSSQMAYALCNGLQGIRPNGTVKGQAGLRCRTGSNQIKQLRHTASEGLSFWVNGSVGQPKSITESKRPNWWATEPNVGRVAHGVAARVDRLKAIGNGQVPLCAATAWRILK